jgi:effector-binding domain-containing protein
MQEIGERIGELMPSIMAVARDAVAGPVFARWHGWDVETGEGDMELGVPVSRAVEGAGDVAAAELPSGRAVVYWHHGSYEGLAASWNLVREWMEKQQLVSRDACWEEYTTDCTVTPVEEMRTRIVWPVE